MLGTIPCALTSPVPDFRELSGWALPTLPLSRLMGKASLLDIRRKRNWGWAGQGRENRCLREGWFGTDFLLYYSALEPPVLTLGSVRRAAEIVSESNYNIRIIMTAVNI